MIINVYLLQFLQVVSAAKMFSIMLSAFDSILLSYYKTDWCNYAGLPGTLYLVDSSHGLEFRRKKHYWEFSILELEYRHAIIGKCVWFSF